MGVDTHKGGTIAMLLSTMIDINLERPCNPVRVLRSTYVVREGLKNKQRETRYCWVNDQALGFKP